MKNLFWRRAFVVATIFSGLVFASGCAARVPADGVEPDEILGEWGVNDLDESTTLTLFADGQFEASSWPSNLMCSAPLATNTSDISYANLVEFSGSWEIPGGVGSTVIFRPGSDACAQESWYSYLERDGLGELQMSTFLEEPELEASVPEEHMIRIVRR